MTVVIHLSWLLPGGLVWVQTSAMGFEEPLLPFLEEHCYECHDEVTAKGGLDLFNLGNDLADEATRERWIRIYDQVEQGIMPPEEKARPGAETRAAFLYGLHGPLVEAHEAERGTVLRRLNRQEYENTMNDLFGTRLGLVARLPEDGRVEGFDTVGEGLNLSMVHLQRYMDAARAVIDTAIADRTAPPEVRRWTASYVDSPGEKRHFENSWLERPDGSAVFFRGTGYPDGSLRETSPRISGRYRVRVVGYAYQADRPITFMVQAKTYQRGAEQPVLGYWAMPPGQPTTVEFETWIEKGYRLAIQPQGLFSDERAFREQGPKRWKGPGLAIQRIELEGPLTEEFPSRGHRLLLDGLERREIEPSNPQVKAKSWYVPEFEIVSDDLLAEIIPAIRRTAGHAFRRPVSREEITPYLDLFENELAGGESPEEALRTAAVAIFCSPDFLFLREPEGELNDTALAARLSYFLTRTTPDTRLKELAAGGRLQGEPELLKAEVDRLLSDSLSERFIEDFTDSWLDLRNIDFTAPDRQLFPEFDRYLQWSMVEETRAYLRQLFSENLPVANLVKSDFAMLNERLADHYGIEGVAGPDLRRVSLPADTVRGGFLSQGSILKVSANGTNTSPVLRGVWVLERILGVTPSPPPPSVPGLEPDIRGAKTLRQLLDQHRDSETCQGCHEMIDPPGFALESFDPIGGWRKTFRVLENGERPEIQVKGRRVNYRIGPPVDASGEHRSYGGFAGYREFRDALANDEERLARTLVTKLLVFATGREMGFSDRPEIDRLVKDYRDNGDGVRDLLYAVVTSPIFRHK